MMTKADQQNYQLWQQYMALKRHGYMFMQLSLNGWLCIIITEAAFMSVNAIIFFVQNAY